MFAYVTLLTTDNYYFGVLSLKLSLDKVKAQYPLVVLYTDEINQKYINELELLGCICKKQTIQFDFRNNRWHQIYLKFEAYKLIEYNKICFLDADMLILENIDYLFEVDEPYIYEIYRNQSTTGNICACFLILTPDIDLYNQIIDFTINFFEISKANGYKSASFTEEEILSIFYLNNPKYTFSYLQQGIIEHVVNRDKPSKKNNKVIYHYMGLKKPWEIYTNYFWNFYLQFIVENNEFFQKHYFSLK